MPIVSPDQVNRQKQDLEDAASLAQHRAGVRVEYGRRQKGPKGQLVTTVLVIAAVIGTVIVLSQFGIL